ncbi:methyltransferase domain-containing protein [Muricauda sp. NFXS6]|uniref:class I SAM-dependent methyltransferase n=1 Tax=Allomuricauda sp. NFXS6 TaxID=2819094 RepID=UPI0032DF7C81
MEKYDRIGRGYDSTRSADDHILGRMAELMGPVKKGRYLDVGCGTGNYTAGLHAMGYPIAGLDPSMEMIATAKKKFPKIDWHLGSAENPGMPRGSIQGIFATLTLHHWPDLKAAFRALDTILVPDGRMVIFSSDPQQMAGYWLNHYFPDMMQSSIDQMPSLEQIKRSLWNTSLELRMIQSYNIRPDLKDLFLYCGKHRPERYLDPVIRKGISSFADLAYANEVALGLIHLERDIESGQIDRIMQTYANGDGDYRFFVLEKPSSS